MQVKIVIGTISFMLTMIILGFAALREPARLEAFAAAEVGRSIENGAHTYFSQCATCHGMEGKAEQCFDAAGESIACQGLSLQNYHLICGDRPRRLEQLRWEGTKQALIETTIAAGRPGTVMPTWSDEFGGPMRDDQVQDVAAFILNWESEEFCAEVPVDYDWADLVEDELAKHEPGDAVRGEDLYISGYGCNACHGLLDNSGSAAIGPWLGDIAERGGNLVDGQSAEQYVYRSILEPNEFIAPECPTGPCSGPVSNMPQDFANKMSSNPQDMADLLAYLLGQ